ncbi:hypothetical protein D3C77_438940 [compost metagenome]
MEGISQRCKPEIIFNIKRCSHIILRPGKRADQGGAYLLVFVCPVMETTEIHIHTPVLRIHVDNYGTEPPFTRFMRQIDSRSSQSVSTMTRYSNGAANPPANIS